MDTDRLNRWLTLGANIGIIVGIVFLAIEVNQNVMGHIDRTGKD